MKKIKKIKPIFGIKKTSGRKIRQPRMTPLEKRRCKKNWPVLAGFFVGFFVSLIITGFYFSRTAKTLRHSESPAGKIDDAEKPIPPPSAPILSAPKVVSPGETYAFSGTVVSVEGDIITIDMFRCGEGHRSYKMSVTSKTIIMKRENEREISADLTDIKENYNVVVESFEDIKNKESLEAKKIILMSQNNFNSAN